MNWSEDQVLLELKVDHNIDPAINFLDNPRMVLVFKVGIQIQQPEVASMKNHHKKSWH